MTTERYAHLINLDTWETGAVCAKEGVPRASNPHALGSDNRLAWELGWDEMQAATEDSKPFTNCCGMDSATCDCVHPDHNGTKQQSLP